MKKTKTLFDQAIEIIEKGGSPFLLLNKEYDSKQHNFFSDTTRGRMDDKGNIYDYSDGTLYTRLLLARELWNDGQEKYWKQGLFK